MKRNTYNRNGMARIAVSLLFCFMFSVLPVSIIALSQNGWNAKCTGVPSPILEEEVKHARTYDPCDQNLAVANAPLEELAALENEACLPSPHVEDPERPPRYSL